MASANRFFYCKSCSLIFRISSVAYNFHERKTNEIKCPLCGSESLSNDDELIEVMVNRMLRLLEELENIRREIEELNSGLDKLFIKLVYARENGVFVSQHLDITILNLFTEMDQLGVHFTKFIYDINADLKQRLRDLINELREESKARLNEHLPVNLSAFYLEKLKGLLDNLERAKKEISKIRGEVSYIYSLVDLKKALQIDETLSDVIMEGNYALVISERYVYEIYLPQKKIIRKIELASIQNVEKGRFSKLAYLHLIKGKVKTHLRYSNELRLRILKLAVVEQPKSNLKDLLLLKEVVFPSFLNITNAIISLKEEMLRQLLKLNKLIMKSKDTFANQIASLARY